MADYLWLKDTILKSFQSFTLPTEIQLAPDSIMRLIWCCFKSGIPYSARDCGYKRYEFGLLDVHVQLYTIMQFSFETAVILDFIIN
jgi:hypothetical protein